MQIEDLKRKRKWEKNAMKSESQEKKKKTRRETLHEKNTLLINPRMKIL